MSLNVCQFITYRIQSMLYVIRFFYIVIVKNENLSLTEIPNILKISVCVLLIDK